jgi:hypothetical protein
MDNFTFGQFSEMDQYDAREEFAREEQEDCNNWDPIMGDADDWVETDDDFAADYYGEEEFA